MILVTGGLGYIGSHIALYLMSKGHEVVIVDNLSHSSMETLERLEYITKMYIPFIRLDIRNTPALQKIFEQYQIEYVINAAGFKSLHEAKIRPLDYYNNNISLVMSLLRAMQRASVRRLVNLSSITVYGQNGLSFKEEDADFTQVFDNPYIHAQQMVEQILNDVYQVDDYWQIMNLRLSNVIGAYEEAKLGEWTPPLPNSLLPYLLQVASGQRDIFDLHHYDLETKDGSAERSYIHIMDVVDVVYKLMLWSNQQDNYLKHVNVAHPEVSSVKQVISAVEALTQCKITVENLPQLYPQFSQLNADITHLKQLIGWQPKYKLEDMIRHQWDYYQVQLAKKNQSTHP